LSASPGGGGGVSDGYGRGGVAAAGDGDGDIWLLKKKRNGLGYPAYAATAKSPKVSS